MHDAQEVIEAYRSLDDYSERGEFYLRIYGLSQAFVLQQDAGRAIWNALGRSVDWAAYGLGEVRKIRIAVAHPTRTRADEASHYIVQATLSPYSFSMLSTSGPDQEWRDIAVLEFLQTQEGGIKRFLKRND